MPAGNAMQSLHFDFFFPFTWFLPSLHPNVHEEGQYLIKLHYGQSPVVPCLFSPVCRGGLGKCWRRAPGIKHEQKCQCCSCLMGHSAAAAMGPRHMAGAWEMEILLLVLHLTCYLLTVIALLCFPVSQNCFSMSVRC